MSKVRMEKQVVNVDSRSGVPIERDEEYAKTQRAALALLERGYHLGEIHAIPRDALHERPSIRTLSKPR
jgi:hypothetical protein